MSSEWLQLGAACAFCVAGLLTITPVADAQIYSWHDANGTLVLSDRPSRDEPMTTFPVDPEGTIQVAHTVGPVRPSSYDHLIRQNAALFDIRADLVRAIIQVESGFDPGAHSPKGAMGLMQLMPSTAADLGVTNAYDPAQNIRGGVGYLRSLLDRYDGDETLALAAYNAGPASVERYGRQVPPYRETQDYVLKVGDAAPAPVSTRIYKTVDLIGGRSVPKYTNVKPVADPPGVATTGR